MGDSNPQSDETKIDEGWDDEPDSGGGAPEIAAERPERAALPASAPRPATSAPTAAPPVVNAWGPVPASRPPLSGPPLGTIGAPAVAPRPAVLARPVEPRPVEPRPVEPREPTVNRAVEPGPARADMAAVASPAPRIDPAPLRASPAAARASAIANSPQQAIAQPTPKAKFGSAPKEARAAKVAKKAAKKAARQAERKARAKNNNRAAIRATAAAAERRADPAAPSASARAERRKAVSSSVPEMGRGRDASDRAAKSSPAAAVRSMGGARSMSTMLMILAAAVLVLAALGWFLAQRH